MIPLERYEIVQNFLNTICSQVWNKNNHERIRSELLTHLEAAVTENMENLGADEYRALILALEELGDPYELGRKFGMVHKPRWLQVLQWSSVAIGITFFIFIVITHRTLRNYETQVSEYQADVSTVVHRFFEDQKILAGDSFFQPASRLHDAGELLNDRIRWQVPERLKHVAGVWWPEYVPDFQLQGKILGSWKTNWYEYANQIDFSRTDLSLFQNLKNYDHWDLYKYGPLKQVIETQNLLFSPYEMPLPDYETLQVMAKLRLLKGLQEKKMLGALQDVRHFARLIYSHEVFVGTMVSISILDVERVAYEQAVRSHLIAARDWTPYAKEKLDMIKRTSWAFGGFFNLRMKPEVIKKVFLESRAHVGLCSGVAEGVISTMLVKGFFTRRMPFEKDYNGNLALLDQILKKTTESCRLTYSRYLWEDEERFKSMLFSNRENFSLFPDWDTDRFLYGIHIPFYRRVVGMELQATADPDFIVSRYK